MNWDAFFYLLIAVGAAALGVALVAWFLRPRPPKHYAISGTGSHCICRCGYHNVWDYDLRKHIAAWEETK